MPGITEIAGKIAGLISLAAFVPYIIATLRRKTRPNRATWFIWMMLGIALGASYYFSGAGDTIWVPISYAIGPLIVFLLSIKYGEGGWNRFDLACLAGAVIGLILWAIFKNPIIALIINLLVDFAGALPTTVKAYKDPKSEDPIAWVLFLAGNTVNLFAIDQYKFAIMVYPIYMFLGSGVITALILWPKKRKKKPAITS